MEQKTLWTTCWLDKKFTIWKFGIAIEGRRNDPVFGRFGGGWRWKLGITIGRRTVLLDLVFIMVRIDLIKRKEGDE